MAMFEFLLQPDAGEPVEMTAGMRDVRLWEKTHPKRSMGQLQDGAGISATILFEVAYSAAKRQGRIPAGMTEDEFVEQYEIDVETPDEKAARLRAEDLKRRIQDGVPPADDDEGDPSGLDPTPAAVSAAG